MSNIFISYAREDRDWAQRIAKALEQEGWSVWWDHKVATGKAFSRVIETELEATDCVMVIWSEHSVNSDWVRAEAAEGLRNNHLVPVSIDSAEPPLIFRQIQTADLSQWDGSPKSSSFRQLAEDIRPLIAESKRGTIPATTPPPLKKQFTSKPPKDRKYFKWYATVGALLMVIGLLIARPYLKPFLFGQKQIPHAQIIDFAATPPIINAGGSITLSWKTENAEKVTLSTEEDSTGEDLEPVGTKIVDLRDTTVFSLKAMGRDPERKVVVAKITVTVTPEAVKPDPQIIVFETDRNVLIRGESTVLHWETDKAARIELNDNIVNPRGELEIRPDQTTTYRLIAVNESGKYNSKSITIKVDDLPRDEIAEIQDLLKMLGYNIGVADGLVGQRTQAAIEAFQNEHGLPATGLPSRDLAEDLRDVHRSVPAPEIVVFKSDRQKITRGDTLTLLWQTSNTDKVRLNPIGEVKLSGERTVQPTDHTVYELEATNRVGRSVQRTIRIHVQVPLEIESLTVDRQRIGPDAKTTIHWRTSGAERVELIPIGSVGLSGSKIVSPNETTRYELIATNDAGEKKRRSITIDFVNRPEIHLFQADSMRVKPGDYVTLSWSTRNASRVELTGIGAVEKIGNHRIRVDRSKEFKLIAANQFSERVSKTLSVETVCPPSVDEFRADRTVIFQGEFSYLHWKTSCADKVAISDLSNNVSQYGSRQVAPSLTTTYQITARGFENQVDSEKVTIFVKPTSTVKTVCSPSIDEFRADRTIIFQGEFTYLHWKTSCADKVAISDLSNNVSQYGRWQVAPSLTTTYRITARNFENQMDSEKVTIYVKPP